MMDADRWVRKQPQGERRKVLAATKAVKAFAAKLVLQRLKRGEMFRLEEAGKVLGLLSELEDALAASFKPSPECC